MYGSNHAVSGRVRLGLTAPKLRRLSKGIALAIALSTSSAAAFGRQPVTPVSGAVKGEEITINAAALTDSQAASALELVLPAPVDRIGWHAPTDIEPAAVDLGKPFVFPDPAPVRPVAIPYPTAAHLFIPGALLALYASRRYRGRRSH